MTPPVGSCGVCSRYVGSGGALLAADAKADVRQDLESFDRDGVATAEALSVRAVGQPLTRRTDLLEHPPDGGGLCGRQVLLGMSGAGFYGAELDEARVPLVFEALTGFVHREVLGAAHVCTHGSGRPFGIGSGNNSGSADVGGVG